MKKFSNPNGSNSLFIERIRSIRQKALQNRKNYNEKQLNEPISFWIKKDRLINESGKEFTILLRTKGCSWALGENGGCTMCGYIQDAKCEIVNQRQIMNQFDFAINNKIKDISIDHDNYVMKIFNSGSFFDDTEISNKTRNYIYEKIAKIDNVKEFIIESRPEYLNNEKIAELRENLKEKYIEIAIGLETVTDYIRTNYINKGMLYNDFKDAVNVCNKNNIGVKAYLLLKPPFLNEQGAIEDCIKSIQALINLGINTISINPVNVQRGTLVEFLWYRNKYRPPWFYSLFKVLKKAMNQNDLNKIRLLSDPSGTGTKRGIHNCLKRECNAEAKQALKSFVLTQDLSVLDQLENKCDCKRDYQFQKLFC